MIERICKNCRLFNDKDNVCSVIVLHEGAKYELPVKPYDECHWEKIDKDVQHQLLGRLDREPEAYFKAKYSGETEVPIEIKQIRMWSDGTNGYIERPEDVT